MYLKSDDLKILYQIESYLFGVNKNGMKFINNNFIITKENVKDMYALELYLNLYNIIENLENNKKEINKKNYERIIEKRKTNKFYARSKKEIEQMKRSD